MVKLVLGHFPHNASILTTFVEMALAAAQTAATAAASNSDTAEVESQRQACQQLQTLVLEQLAAADQMQHMLAQVSTVCNSS